MRMDADYVRWYQPTHPKAIDVREATRNWLDRREQLKRHQRCAPGSYEAYLRDKNRIGTFDAHTPDRWDNGKLWRMHMIQQKQAAFDMNTSSFDNGIYIAEQDIDDWLIRQDQRLNDDDRSPATARTSAEGIREGHPKHGPRNDTPADTSTYSPNRPHGT